ncbi:MAG: hypothetical protein JRH14_00665 [Deltaproteobacteria bacterium]|nr:hypothetical protein [Deltaproteobacteria bacterium]MBW2375295.1 hypothetical protein [Deltaproteobacteria bacterium]
MKSVDSDKASAHRAILESAVLMPLLRLALFLTAVCVFAAALLLRSARADATESFWTLGSHMAGFPGAPHEGVRQLQLNGVRVSFRTQTVEASLADVLAHYEATCGTAIATQSARSDSAGYVACLDMGDPPPDLGGLANRFLRFSETGDLREVGAAHYILARRVASGSADKTFLFTMWVDSGFNLYTTVPHAGADAAGRDLTGVPRPPGSQRILSAWEERQPSGILVYRVVGKSAEELESFYRTRLPRNGWTIVERHPSESIQVDGTHMLSAEQDNRLVTVLSHPGEASQTVLTILASEP